MFRVSSQGLPYSDLLPRFEALVTAFGVDRLLFGSDFPWSMQQGEYGDSLEAVRGWAEGLLDEEGAGKVMGGNACRLFRLGPMRGSEPG